MREITDFHEAMVYLASPENTDILEHFEVLAWVLKTAQPFLRAAIERKIGIDLAEVERLRLELSSLIYKGEVH